MKKSQISTQQVLVLDISIEFKKLLSLLVALCPLSTWGYLYALKKFQQIVMELWRKIVARIKGWSSRNLSYVGRVQLVNSYSASIVCPT